MLRVLLCAAIVLAPSRAYAWEQATTGSGLVLFQQQRCLYWSLSDAGSRDVLDEAALHEAVRRGFDVWNEPACSSLSFIDAGPSACTEPDLADRGTQVSLVVFYEDDWPFESPLGNPFAATGLWYDPDTGQILDADVALNALLYTWSTDGSAGTVDVQSIVAHEAGHVLGLGESPDVEATMYGYSLLEETSKRDLAPDDEEGLCALYPSGETDRPCPSSPGSAALCIPDGGCGCAATGASRPRTGPAEAVLGVVLALLWASSRRRRSPDGRT